MIMADFDFLHPWLLLLLPLAVLPLLARKRDQVAFPAAPWLPPDRLGAAAYHVWRGAAVLAIAALVLALAGPGRPESLVARTGRGAEILLLMDRSRSMDDRMLPSDWRSIDPIVVYQQARSRGPVKIQVARDVLAKFVRERPADRFALSFFSTNAIQVLPFTQHGDAIQGGIAAGAIGRGLADTDVGRALVAAIGAFDGRAYSGSRIILLISDGGAQLDDDTKERIRRGLARNHVALYWIYLRSIAGPELDKDQDEGRAEIALHHFFRSLATPYRAYQAEIPEDLSKAVADVGEQQNLPLDYLERIPRRDDAPACMAAAVLACLLLLAYRLLLIGKWK
jgi:mxaC protein